MIENKRDEMHMMIIFVRSHSIEDSDDYHLELLRWENDGGKSA